MHRRIVLLGPPAAGKGTQADLLQREYGYATPSVGAMLRQQRAAGTPAGLRAAEYFERGLLVPDEITIEVVQHWLSGNQGLWILDGFPRTVGQSEAFEAMLRRDGVAVDVVLFLNVDEPSVRERAARRLVCTACGGIFREGLHVTRAEERCPRCEGALTRRADDEAETVTRRLAEYRERTAPLIPHYRERGLLHELDGNRPVELIFAEIARTLGCPAATSEA